MECHLEQNCGYGPLRQFDTSTSYNLPENRLYIVSLSFPNPCAKEAHSLWS